MVKASMVLCLAAEASGQLRGQQGECVGTRFHSVAYDMSEETHPESGLPRHFSISMTPSPEDDEQCTANREANADGIKKGVCVGVNTADCHGSRGSLSINEYLSCEDCFAGLVTDVAYDLKVRDFKVQKVRFALERMHFVGALQFLAHDATRTVAEGTFPIIGQDQDFNIDFLVAGVVPISIKFKMPTQLHWSASLSQSVDVRFGADVDMGLGDHLVEWTSEKGWNVPKANTSVSWTPVLKAEAEVQAEMPIRLESKLMVELEHVLDYNLNFAPSLPLRAEMDLDKMCLRSDADFEIDHEAKLQFTLFGHNATLADWGPKTLYSHHWDKVFNKCMDLPFHDVLV